MNNKLTTMLFLFAAATPAVLVKLVEGQGETLSALGLFFGILLSLGICQIARLLLRRARLEQLQGVVRVATVVIRKNPTHSWSEEAFSITR